MSSVMHTVPGTPASICEIILWKITRAEDMPNRSLWKQKQPKGVINVVINADSRARGSCQKTELASSLERMLAPASFPSTWSTDGSGCCSRWTLWLSLVRSIQMQTFPFGFGTTAMPEHQLVGCSFFWLGIIVVSWGLPAPLVWLILGRSLASQRLITALGEVVDCLDGAFHVRDCFFLPGSSDDWLLLLDGLCLTDSGDSFL